MLRYPTPSLLHQLRAIAAASGAASSRSLNDAAGQAASRLPQDGLRLQDFIRQGRSSTSVMAAAPGDSSAAAAAAASGSPPLRENSAATQPGSVAQRTAFIETYGW